MSEHGNYFEPDEHGLCVNYLNRRECRHCQYQPIQFDSGMTAKQYIHYVRQHKGRGGRCYRGHVVIMFACTAQDMGRRDQDE